MLAVSLIGRGQDALKCYASNKVRSAGITWKTLNSRSYAHLTRVAAVKGEWNWLLELEGMLSR